jgi:hypothetical protein
MINTHIQPLRDHEAVRRLLLRHGWRLGQVNATQFSAKHPSVDDEHAARDRLNDLGLLTSSAVRIEFDRYARRPLSPGRARR